ncbi:VOC family protein [Mucilaginibacter flavus]|uniref:VOC family protein n=1 Tax=Mucilaginibacter flavus TaxID=931504 RepID=UPI0025B5E329|nr:VOC family protein [Mucilaginibacter flavus]MDN3579756.1 VOC family protein [Mucilaginibacter flavus]
MVTINPYVNFPGNTEEAFNFYKSVFGGEFAAVIRFADMGAENVAEEDKNKLMHIALPIGKGNILMATDTVGEMGMGYKQGNNFHLSLNVESKEEGDTIYNALSADGITTVPMSMSAWGSYFGMLVDKFGISWMVSFDEIRG